MPFALSEMILTSSAFGEGEPIPERHTGEGEDVSPPLSWQGAPSTTQSFAVFCLDPDAPLISANGNYGFVHWVLYNLPASTTSLAEGSSEGTSGHTSVGKAGYGGPMPPEGHGVHRYYFCVLALDADPKLDPDLTLWQLLQTVEPHVIGMNRLVGTYQRN